MVIGGGSGGMTAAVGLAKVGKSVLLLEREHLGGECTNSGCIPSKSLLYRAKTYHQAKSLAGETAATEAYKDESLDYVRVKIKAILAEETPAAFEKLGIMVVMGEAAFSGPNQLNVNHETYHFKTAIIASGSAPRQLTIEGLPTDKILTNQNIFTLTHLPEKLLVVGSGPIGLELGQAFAFLGSEVTLATIDGRLARLEDEAIDAKLEKHFTELGISLLKQAHLTKVVSGEAYFNIMKDGQPVNEVKAAFTEVLVATGRVPNLPEGLKAAGVNYTEHGITIDKHYRTTNKNIYAVGDVSLRLKFTHTADDAARHVATRLATGGLWGGKTNKAVPKVTYTNPTMAQVGLSEVLAKEQYGEAEIIRLEVPYTQNDRAKTDAAEDGLLIVIAARLSGRVLGVHIIGQAAGEMIALFTLAIDRRISLWRLRSLIFAYPTYSLLIKKTGDIFLARQLASLKPDLKRRLKKHLPKIIALLFWLGLLWLFFSYREVKEMNNLELLGLLFDFVSSSTLGALLYTIVYAMRPLIFFPATLLTFLSGALFGFWWGIFYTIIGENLSANLAYWIGRFFGKDLKLENSLLSSWVTKMRDNAFTTVLLMRLLFVPFDLTNYGAGVVRVRWISYCLATLIGTLPAMAVFISLGAAFEGNIRNLTISFDALNPVFLAVSATTFVGSLLLADILRRLTAKKPPS